jgi:hypothetical protein
MNLPFVFFSFITVAGIAAVMIGRTLKAYDDEKWKGEYWWREVMYGPTGYRRASVIGLGFVLVVVGAIGVVSSLLPR